MRGVAKAPDIEIKRQLKNRNGLWRTYAHLYWKPFIVVVNNRVIIGKKHFLTPRGKIPH